MEQGDFFGDLATRSPDYAGPAASNPPAAVKKWRPPKPLTLFDYYEKKTVPKSSAKKKPSPPVKKKSDLIIGLKDKKVKGAKGQFYFSGELGLAKLELIGRAGSVAFCGIEKRDHTAIGFVRGSHKSDFDLLNRSVIRWTFDPAADNTIKALQREYKRRNITLKVDVDPAEVLVNDTV